MKLNYFLLGCIVSSFLITFLWCMDVIEYRSQVQKIQGEAVAFGYGKWEVIDNKTGKIQFSWSSEGEQ